jgi:hypothetical protein
MIVPNTPILEYKNKKYQKVLFKTKAMSTCKQCGLNSAPDEFCKLHCSSGNVVWKEIKSLT